MKTVTLSAHFDGTQIRLEEPYELEPDTKLLVTIVPDAARDGEDDEERFRRDWEQLATSALAHAYSDDEPEYPDSMIREPNPEYGKR